MPYQIGDTPYSLSDDAIRNAEEIHLQTKKTGLEHNTTLCANGASVLYPGGQCVGTVCSVMPRDCQDTGMREAGGLHTHPKGSADPSAGDLLWATFKALSGYSNEYIGCRTGQDDRMRCDFLRVQSSERDNLKGLYVKQLPKYEHALTFWKEWVRTGVQPPHDDERIKEAEEVTRTLQGFFRTYWAPIGELHESIISKPTTTGMSAQDLAWYHSQIGIAKRRRK